MYATERQALIARLVTSRGRASVAELADEVGVTGETVRRDLDQLESAGALRRVHGGAISADRGSTVERSVHERRPRDLDAKRAIAATAAAMLPEDFTGTVLLDAGTTAELVAERLAERGAAHGLTIVSNAVPITARLAGVPGIEVVSIGGRVRGLTAAAVGPAALAQLGALRVDLAFIGANGLSAGFGLSTPDEDEAAVKHAMIRAGRRAIVVADSSKFDVEALTRFATFDEVDGLVSEAAPTGGLASALAEAGVEAVVA